jgi:hypothetical protein
MHSPLVAHFAQPCVVVLQIGLVAAVQSLLWLQATQVPWAQTGVPVFDAHCASVLHSTHPGNSPTDTGGGDSGTAPQTGFSGVFREHTSVEHGTQRWDPARSQIGFAGVAAQLAAEVQGGGAAPPVPGIPPRPPEAAPPEPAAPDPPAARPPEATRPIPPGPPAPPRPPPPGLLPPESPPPSTAASTCTHW